ncbi:MAG: superoxide dismutase [Planctomycetes bacterium]|nr:superoxide dismutase [Planctomycetota bacterium]
MVVSPYTLPPLPYAYDALEPYLGARTLELHHDTHHAGYVRGANEAVSNLVEARRTGSTSMAGEYAAKLAFHASGHVLHTLYWENMAPDGGGAPQGRVGGMIRRQFGSYDAFVKQFKAIGTSVEGSGWGVLAYEPRGGLLVIAPVKNHENVVVMGMEPLLVVDVWEHAYYLDYQSDRGKYFDVWMEHLVSWPAVDQRLAAVVR